MRYVVLSLLLIVALVINSRPSFGQQAATLVTGEDVQQATTQLLHQILADAQSVSLKESTTLGSLPTDTLIQEAQARVRAELADLERLQQAIEIRETTLRLDAANQRIREKLRAADEQLGATRRLRAALLKRAKAVETPAANRTRLGTQTSKLLSVGIQIRLRLLCGCFAEIHLHSDGRFCLHCAHRTGRLSRTTLPVHSNAPPGWSLLAILADGSTKVFRHPKSDSFTVVR